MKVLLDPGQRPLIQIKGSMGEINFPVIGRYVDYLVKEQGVKNIFVNGTTGEGLSLSLSERRRVAEEWVTQGRNKLEQVVIHVGALSLKESQELAQHAAEIGADGIAVIAPFFFKSQNKGAGCRQVRAEELLDGIQETIPTFQGLKFSDTDLLDFGQCVDQNHQRQFALLFGVDEFCIQRFINYVIKLGFGVSQTKAIMTLVSGIPMGPPRLPLQKATQEFTANAKDKLKSLNFLV
ncbi:N-acetylneuraminate lyase [Cricetulus griseus]|uniref:N-acetylneuraminate lyase n=1 Tax=Cricetulus griseus TaxID=10029 RepID=G3HG28_CRIGR|nr:N-acetylneuraminate lyase [Cricetulus griseus]